MEGNEIYYQFSLNNLRKRIRFRDEIRFCWKSTSATSKVAATNIFSSRRHAAYIRGGARRRKRLHEQSLPGPLGEKA